MATTQSKRKTLALINKQNIACANCGLTELQSEFVGKPDVHAAKIQGRQERKRREDLSACKKRKFKGTHKPKQKAAKAGRSASERQLPEPEQLHHARRAQQMLREERLRQRMFDRLVGPIEDQLIRSNTDLLNPGPTKRYVVRRATNGPAKAPLRITVLKAQQPIEREVTREPASAALKAQIAATFHTSPSSAPVPAADPVAHVAVIDVLRESVAAMGLPADHVEALVTSGNAAATMPVVTNTMRVAEMERSGVDPERISAMGPIEFKAEGDLACALAQLEDTTMDLGGLFDDEDSACVAGSHATEAAAASAAAASVTATAAGSLVEPVTVVPDKTGWASTAPPAPDMSEHNDMYAIMRDHEYEVTAAAFKAAAVPFMTCAPPVAAADNAAARGRRAGRPLRVTVTHSSGSDSDDYDLQRAPPAGYQHSDGSIEPAASPHVLLDLGCPCDPPHDDNGGPFEPFDSDNTAIDRACAVAHDNDECPPEQSGEPEPAADSVASVPSVTPPQDTVRVFSGRVLEAPEVAQLVTRKLGLSWTAVQELTVVPVVKDERIIQNLGVPIQSFPYELARIRCKLCRPWLPAVMRYWFFVLRVVSGPCSSWVTLMDIWPQIICGLFAFVTVALVCGYIDLMLGLGVVATTAGVWGALNKSDWLWPDRELLYLPHLVTAVMQEYALDRDPEISVRTIRQRLLSCPSFPLHDVHSEEILDCTEAVIALLLEQQNFTLPPSRAYVDSLFLLGGVEGSQMRCSQDMLGVTDLVKSLFLALMGPPAQVVENTSERRLSVSLDPRTSSHYRNALCQVSDQFHAIEETRKRIAKESTKDSSAQRPPLRKKT